MRIGVVLLVLLATASCGGGLFRQYEYEEEMYLSLDGSATVYVNASVAALNALRGTSFDSSPNARIDRDAVGAYFTSAVTGAPRSVTLSRRNSRRFVHVRLDVENVRRLMEAPAFSWASYQFAEDNGLLVFQQSVGKPARDLDQVNRVNWTGDEIVAFRIHVPSKIGWHNAGAGNLQRGNILVWEQSLGERLQGTPLAIEARMDRESILYRTLWLFAGTVVAVAFTFALAIWLVVRRGGKAAPPVSSER